ncbi:unnamed protein product, partial [Mesorhabditis spiculigera]
MPRVTRSTAKGSLSEELKEDGQGKLTDYFRTTRPGRRPGKNAKLGTNDAPIASSEMILPESGKLPSPPKLKRVEEPEPVAKDAAAPAEGSRQTLPLKEKATTPKRVARKLFAEESPIKHEEAATLEDPNLESTAAPIDLLLKSERTPTRAKQSVRTVQELQKILAERGAAKNIHKQAVENKERRAVSALAARLSPKKTVTTRILSVAEEKKAAPTKLSTVSVPDYVLPSTDALKPQVNLRETTPEPVTSDYKTKSSLLKPEVKESAWIALSRVYAQLHNKFQSGDRVLSIMSQQGKRIVFEDLAENIRKNIRQNFVLSDFAKIVHLYKEAYNVKLEESWQAFGGAQRGKWQLVISPNVTDDLRGWQVEEAASKELSGELPLSRPSQLCSPTKSPRKVACKPLARAPKLEDKVRLEGWRMLCRAQIFRHKLTELVLRAHAAFCESVGVKLDESKPLRRLHPGFDVENCDELAEAKLPEPPKLETNGATTMADFMRKLDEAQLPKGAKKVLEALKSPQKATASGVPLSPKKFAETAAAKGGMGGLLARIRAKEAAKKAVESAIDPVKEKRIARIDKLILGTLRTLTSVFALKKTHSLAMTVIAENVLRSTRFLAYEEAVGCVELLCEISPKNICVSEVHGQKYVQLTKNDYDAMLADLKQEKAFLAN